MLTRAEQLQDRARRCRELADTAATEEGRSILFEIAQRYEHEAGASEERVGERSLAEATT